MSRDEYERLYRELTLQYEEAAYDLLLKFEDSQGTGNLNSNHILSNTI